MRKILLTGMSGTGKSAALAELEKRGFAVVDTDHGGWSEWSDADGGYVWREDRIAELLAREQGPTLYISGTVSNQGRFYPQFDAVVLLSAPAEGAPSPHRHESNERLRQEQRRSRPHPAPPGEGRTAAARNLHA